MPQGTLLPKVWTEKVEKKREEKIKFINSKFTKTELKAIELGNFVFECAKLLTKLSNSIAFNSVFVNLLLINFIFSFYFFSTFSVHTLGKRVPCGICTSSDTNLPFTF
jgi:hypothetical protein